MSLVGIAVEPVQERLTSRQLTVLALHASGLSRDEIARQLIVSPHTVKVDMDRLRAKLEAHTVTHALTIALAQGIVQIAAPGLVVIPETEVL